MCVGVDGEEKGLFFFLNISNLIIQTSLISESKALQKNYDRDVIKIFNIYHFFKLVNKWKYKKCKYLQEMEVKLFRMGAE